MTGNKMGRHSGTRNRCTAPLFGVEPKWTASDKQLPCQYHLIGEFLAFLLRYEKMVNLQVSILPTVEASRGTRAFRAHWLAA
jgi:hypothetical protein